MLLSILFLIAFAGAIYWRYYDFTYSSEMIFFNYEEANPLVKDEQGRMSYWRALVLQIMAMTLLFFLHFRVGPLGALFNSFDNSLWVGEGAMPRWVPLVTAIGLNVLGFILVSGHRKRRAFNRIRQYKELDMLKAVYSEDKPWSQIATEAGMLGTHRRKDRLWFTQLPHLYWNVKDGSNYPVDEDMIRTMGRFVNEVPRDQWFSKIVVFGNK